MRAILRQPSLWGTALGLFSTNYVFYFVLTWLPYYVVRERGFSTGEMATLTGSAYLVCALSSIVAGWAIDRCVVAGRATIAYKSVMVVAHLGTVGCMLCIAFASQPWALAGIFAYQVITGAASAGVFAIPQILAGPAAAARWVGVQNCCGNFAGVIAPALTGLLVEETHRFHLHGMTVLDQDVPGPRIVISRSVKGKGVSFMENKMEWHYLPLNEAQYGQAVQEMDR